MNIYANFYAQVYTLSRVFAIQHEHSVYSRFPPVTMITQFLHAFDIRTCAIGYLRAETDNGLNNVYPNYSDRLVRCTGRLVYGTYFSSIISFSRGTLLMISETHMARQG